MVAGLMPPEVDEWRSGCMDREGYFGKRIDAQCPVLVERTATKVGRQGVF